MTNNHLKRELPLVVVDNEWEWLRAKGYEEYICIFKRLRLTPYLFKRMYREFTKADKDNSGALSIEEFFGAFELTFVTPLAKRAFYAFDLDGSGELDYGEFTVSIWNFLSITMGDLGAFFFEVYDLDRSGTLDRAELRKLLEEAYGGPEHMSKFNEDALERVLHRKKESYTLAEFKSMIEHNPTMFWPIKTLQNELKARVVNEKFWDFMARARLATTKFKERSLRFLKESFDPAGYINEMCLVIHKAVNLQPYIIAGTSKDQRYSHAFTKIEIKGLEKYAVRTKVVRNTHSPVFLQEIYYHDLHVTDVATLTIWHSRAGFKVPLPRSMWTFALFSAPQGLVNLPLMAMYNKQASSKRENGTPKVLFKVKKHGEHIVKHDCRIALSWKIELKAPLKDFSVEEPEIPNRNKRRTQQSPKRKVVPQSLIDARAAEERKMRSAEGMFQQQEKAKLQKAKLAKLHAKGKIPEEELTKEQKNKILIEKFERQRERQKLTGDAKVYSEAAAAAEDIYNEFLEDSEEDDAEAARKIMARGPTRPTGARSKWATAAQDRSLH